MKKIILTLLTFLVIVIVWANYKPPSLSERYQTAPAKLVLFETVKEISTREKQSLQQSLVSIRGVKSVAIQSHNIAIMYEKAADAEDWEKLLKKHQIKTRQSALAQYQGAKCPIPHSYIHLSIKLKMLFCFR